MTYKYFVRSGEKAWTNFVATEPGFAHASSRSPIEKSEHKTQSLASLVLSLYEDFRIKRKTPNFSMQSFRPQIAMRKFFSESQQAIT